MANRNNYYLEELAAKKSNTIVITVCVILVIEWFNYWGTAGQALPGTEPAASSGYLLPGCVQ